MVSSAHSFLTHPPVGWKGGHTGRHNSAVERDSERVFRIRRAVELDVDGLDGWWWDDAFIGT